MTRPALLAVSVACLLAATEGLAQAPHEEWRRLETAHFRVVYPAASEDWTLRVAARLESIRERVEDTVGYSPPETIDVLVMDPMAEPNGFALALLRRPRIVLWTSSPPPDSTIGHFEDWGELVALHETAHLVHLLRPSRNPVRRLAARLLPVGPIALGAPRWVTEGYATHVEGQLSGAGRPYSDLRAAVLRRRAQAGELPTYSQLSGDEGSWQGMSMAYLVGSAYLEWLVERADDSDSLRKLWARMTARTARNFEEAFTGVFGQPPESLYKRFCAELTWQAVEAERRVVGELREGELWQDLSWSTGAPQLAPDGQLLALVQRFRDRPSRLVVWSVGPEEEAERRWQERVEKTLAKDPDDVAPVRHGPLDREPRHVLPARDGAEPHWPRWLPDGSGLLFGRFTSDRDGSLHTDLFRWHLAGGEVERVTRLADLREADPGPSGEWAVAVRQRHGASQLVRVDLAGGDVEPLSEASVEVALASPRVSPDGRRVAFLRHAGGRWRLIVRGLEDGREVELETPSAGLVAEPTWSRDGTRVLASVGRQGFIDIHALPADGRGPSRRLTRTLGGAFAPCLHPDGGSLFFLSLEADGLDLRRIAVDEGQPLAEPAELTADLAPAVRPQSPVGIEPFAQVPVVESTDYGVGRLELDALAGGVRAPSASALELGVRTGDVLGRLDLLLVGSVADRGGVDGAAVSGAWRGWPVALEGSAFVAREAPSEQPRRVPGLGTTLDLEEEGVGMSAAWRRDWRSGQLRLDVGSLWERIEVEASDAASSRSLFASADLSRELRRGRWRLELAAAPWWQVGRGGEGTWRRIGGRASLGLGFDATRLEVGWSRAAADGHLTEVDRLYLGGLCSSIVPRIARLGRITEPALPAGTLRGEEHESQRVELRLGDTPLPLFYARHRMWTGDDEHGRWLALAGVVLRLETEPFPLLGLPSLELDLGAARILDEPFEGLTTWWVSVAYRP